MAVLDENISNLAHGVLSTIKIMSTVCVNVLFFIQLEGNEDIDRVGYSDKFQLKFLYVSSLIFVKLLLNTEYPTSLTSLQSNICHISSTKFSGKVSYI